MKQTIQSTPTASEAGVKKNNRRTNNTGVSALVTAAAKRRAVKHATVATKSVSARTPPKVGSSAVTTVQMKSKQTDKAISTMKTKTYSPSKLKGSSSITIISLIVLSCSSTLDVNEGANSSKISSLEAQLENTVSAAPLIL
jgi:hypothetical protein